MQVNIRFLENLKVEARFDDYTIVADQPIRYNGDGSAPGPFDYFLASSAMCAGYFVKVYCKARNIPTDDIKITQNNIIDPENRYKQTWTIDVELPMSISEHDRDGILKSIERCTVKRVIQEKPEFIIKAHTVLGADNNDSLFLTDDLLTQKTSIIGKDLSLEETILNMSKILVDLGIKIEVSSWRNPVPHVWSVHIRDADSPMCFTNGKGTSKNAALASALGEYLERISNNYFYNDYFLGDEIKDASFVHYPKERWFKPGPKDSLPSDLMDKYLKKIYNPDGELKCSHLIDTNSGDSKKGVCAIPYVRQSDKKIVYIPVNLIGNLFVSNGMSAGNTAFEARVQCLSEIFERAVKNKIITEEITLPDVPVSVLNKFPKIVEGIKKLENEGFPIVVKDASLGGKFPVMCVTLMNPRNGGVFASFGAHPKFEVALERSLTELLQGRSFEGMNAIMPPTFNKNAIKEHNNIIDHFIDSTGVISWKFFKSTPDFKFKDWDFCGSTEDEFNYLMNILRNLKKEVYISDFDELGVNACRILVPNYSEIYQIDDLIWDNNNRALKFRDDILNIHKLNDKELSNLLKKLNDSGIDDYTKVSELIGVTFDENSVWGQCDILEIKCLSYLALKRFKNAKVYAEMFMNFNDNTPERKRFYQALNTVLDIELDKKMNIKDYKHNLNRMFGEEVIKNVIGTIKGTVRFYNLPKTDSKLQGLDKHKRLIDSFKKLQKKRGIKAT